MTQKAKKGEIHKHTKDKTNTSNTCKIPALVLFVHLLIRMTTMAMSKIIGRNAMIGFWCWSGWLPAGGAAIAKRASSKFGVVLMIGRWISRYSRLIGKPFCGGRM